MESKKGNSNEMEDEKMGGGFDQNTLHDYMKLQIKKLNFDEISSYEIVLWFTNIKEAVNLAANKEWRR